MVELFLKKNRFFKCDDEEETIENQLKGIFFKIRNREYKAGRN